MSLSWNLISVFLLLNIFTACKSNSAGEEGDTKAIVGPGSRAIDSYWEKDYEHDVDYKIKEAFSSVNPGYHIEFLKLNTASRNSDGIRVDGSPNSYLAIFSNPKDLNLGDFYPARSKVVTKSKVDFKWAARLDPKNPKNIEGFRNQGVFFGGRLIGFVGTVG